MIEAIILLVGLILGYFIKKNKPHHLEKMIKRRHVDLRECVEEKEGLQAENNMLKNPKRLIKEYKGDDGSGTDALRKSMEKSIESLERKKVILEKEITDLQKTKKDLKAKVNTLKSDLMRTLQDLFDNALDEVKGLIDKARKGDLSTQKSVSKRLEIKSKKLQDELSDKDN